VEAFLSKGAGSVIATLWPIADCSAAKFSTAFYRYFFDCQLHVSNALLMTKRRYLTSEDTVDVAGYVLYTQPGGDAQTLRKEWAVDAGTAPM
jgi:CHAT domain-containing protein